MRRSSTARVSARAVARRGGRRRRDHGSALVLVTVVGAMLIVLIGLLIDASLSGSRAASATYHQAGAHLTAMSGLWAGCNSLSQAGTGNTSGATGGGAWSPVASGADADADGFIDFSSDATFRALGDGYFESRARLLGSSAYVVRGRGVHGGVLRTIEAVALPDGYNAARPFSRALFAAHDLAVSGSTTFDSFDSAVGTWADHPTTGNDGLGRALKKGGGAVGSNQRVVLSGATRVHGDARPGPSGTIAINEGATVTGSTAALSEAEAYSPPLWTTPPADDALVNTTALGAYDGGFSASGGTTTLGPGKYVVSSFQLSGTAVVEVAGGPGDVVEIYVTGGAERPDGPSFALTGSSELRIAPGGPTLKIYNVGKLKKETTARLNATGTAAAQLQYFSSYSSDDGSDLGLDLDSSSDLAGVFYAPHAHVDLTSTATVWGSIVGREVVAGGAARFHYDEALRHLTLPAAGKTLFAPAAFHEVH